MTLLWQWVAAAQFIRLFTDGEPRYAQWFWKLAHVWLQHSTLPATYPHRKVWREGIEVASNVKGSQGHRRIKRPHAEHPFTSLSDDSEVHANHNEAHNSSIRRRCSAYRRKQNHYAKTVDGLNRAICSLRLIHNWVRPHPSLEKKTTPAMAMGFIDRPITLLEMLCSKGLQDIP